MISVVEGGSSKGGTPFPSVQRFYLWASSAIVYGLIAGTPSAAFGQARPSEPTTNTTVAASAVNPSPTQTELPPLDAKTDPSQEVQAVESKLSSHSQSKDDVIGPRDYNQPARPRTGGGYPSINWSDVPPAIPPELVEAVTLATKRDPSVLAAWSGARAAVQDAKGARWLRYPSLTTELNVSDASNGLLPSVGVELPIWSGGRISSAISRADKLESAAVSRWRETVLDLALQVSETYFNIVLATRIEQHYAESLEQHLRLVETMKRRVAQEINPLADLELARSRSAQIEQELTTLRSQRDTAVRNLAELTHDPAFSAAQIPDFEPAVLTKAWGDVVDLAVVYSPTRERLQLEADAARAGIALAKGSIFPQVNAQYTYNEISGSRIGLGVRLQTSNGLSQFSAVSSAQARFEQAESQVGVIVRQLRQEVANNVIAHDAAIKRAFVSANASRTASNVSQSYMRQFIAGRRSWLDVMNSLREFLSSQVNLAQAEVGALAAEARLNLLAGIWRPTPSRTDDN